MQEATDWRRLTRGATTGAILGALCAVVAHVLGVQQLIRRPDLALYLPAACLGAVLGVTRLRPLLWIGAGILALLCIIIGYTPLVTMLSAPLIRRDSIPAHVDAVAVLSMGLTPDGLMRSETLDRYLTGLTLARNKSARALIVSRERRSFDGRLVSDSVDLAGITALAADNVPTIFVDSVYTTRTEALRMKSVARKNGWQTIAVVTSPMHTRRACATFEAVGLWVTCVPATVRNSGLHPASSAQQRLHSFQAWLYEIFATDTYRRRGWIK